MISFSLIFISAIHFTLGIYHLSQTFFIYKRIDRYFYFAVTNMAGALFVGLRVPMVADTMAENIIMLHRARSVGLILATSFWIACVYDIFFRKSKLPYINFVVSFLFLLTVPTSFFLGKPAELLRLQLPMDLMFEYHHATPGLGYSVFSVYLSVIFFYSMFKCLFGNEMQGGRRFFGLFFFLPVIGGINDFAVTHGMIQNMMVTEFSVFSFLGATFVIFLREEKTRFVRLQNINTTLEREVQKATVQLMRANQQLVEQAHSAGMAEISTNVVHNIGNVLTNILTSAHMLIDSLENTKLEGLKKANGILRQNENDLNGFLSNDPRAVKLMTYYLQVQKALESEHESLRENADRLLEKARVVNEVIASQQECASQRDFTDHYHLNEIIKAVLRIQESSLIKRNVDVDVGEEEVPKVLLSKNKAMQIFMNIFKNAAEAMEKVPKEKRKIHVSMHASEGTVEARIADNGCGLSDDQMSRIFEHGFTTKKDGYGFGLNSCIKYMQEMNGNIRAESEGPGKGTTLILTFRIDKHNEPRRSDADSRPDESALS